MSDEPKAEGKILAYQMTLTYIPSTGEFGIDAPIADRPACYIMLSMAQERLFILAMQAELNAAKKRLLTPGMNN
jgi:hypothetical protein